MPAKWKIKEVEELAKKIKDSPVIAVANLAGLPSKQLAEIRKKLHGQVQIKVVKNRLAHLAFEKAKKPGLPELESTMQGSTALIFSKDNPFKLYQTFAASRVKGPAKPHGTAPADIVVPAGDTPFKPGPIIGELQEVGIKAKIQGPIIVVMQDSPVIKAGEKFSPKLANVLTQLSIMPMELGVDIRAALENGMVYGSDVLNISKEQVLADMVAGYRAAVNLAVEAGIYNKESVPLMITKAARHARSLAIDAEIYTKDTIDYFLSKADRQAKGLAGEAKYDASAAPAEGA